MPTKGFRWLNDDKIVRDHGAILNLNDDAKDGFIYEIDCTCSHELQSLHSDYPLAPESHTLDESMLSPFQGKNFLSCQAQIKNTTKLTK